MGLDAATLWMDGCLGIWIFTIEWGSFWFFSIYSQPEWMIPSIQLDKNRTFSGGARYNEILWFSTIQWTLILTSTSPLSFALKDSVWMVWRERMIRIIQHVMRLLKPPLIRDAFVFKDISLFIRTPRYCPYLLFSRSTNIVSVRDYLRTCVMEWNLDQYKKELITGPLQWEKGWQ